MEKFREGDMVTWTSQAGGNTKTKVGTVVAVIPGGEASYERARSAIDLRTRAGTHRSAFGGGWSRPAESYVVEVPQGTTGRAKPVLYWPVASALRPFRPE
jgi:hypothetical protein